LFQNEFLFIIISLWIDEWQISDSIAASMEMEMEMEMEMNNVKIN
jgi:hypothetical protein